MNIEPEKFSLSHFGAQFREFNFAVRDNAHRLTPHFWWARAGYTSSLQNAQFATWHKNLNDKTY